MLHPSRGDANFLLQLNYFSAHLLYSTLLGLGFIRRVGNTLLAIIEGVKFWAIELFGFAVSLYFQ